VLKVDASDGAVIGLEGAWGSGKTWVLRQLQELASLKDGARQGSCRLVHAAFG
jgi:ABC-type Na+ transport system ATPase subunit NatA